MKGDQEFLERCIMLVYQHQTDQEQQVRTTQEINHQGFNKADAPLMTKMAEQLMLGHHLTPLQVEVAEAVMGKYARQLGNYTGLE